MAANARIVSSQLSDKTVCESDLPNSPASNTVIPAQHSSGSQDMDLSGWKAKEILTARIKTEMKEIQEALRRLQKPEGRLKVFQTKYCQAWDPGF